MKRIRRKTFPFRIDFSTDSDTCSNHSEETASLSRYASRRETAETPYSNTGNNQSPNSVLRSQKIGKQRYKLRKQT